LNEAEQRLAAAVEAETLSRVAESLRLAGQTLVGLDGGGPVVKLCERLADNINEFPRKYEVPA
jgi:hypothetical protein